MGVLFISLAIVPGASARGTASGSSIARWCQRQRPHGCERARLVETHLEFAWTNAVEPWKIKPSSNESLWSSMNWCKGKSKSSMNCGGFFKTNSRVNGKNTSLVHVPMVHGLPMAVLGKNLSRALVAQSRLLIPVQTWSYMQLLSPIMS